jgi:tRNA-binding EMAP/Myf-like protein
VSFYVFRNTYFAKFEFLVSYGLILCGGEGESSKVLKIQKKILHLIKGVSSRTSDTALNNHTFCYLLVHL